MTTSGGGGGEHPGAVAEAMRFALPWRTRVAVLAVAGDDPPDLGGARTVQLVSLEPPEAAAQALAAAREDGCEYVLIAADAVLPAQAETLLDGFAHVTDAGGYRVFSMHPPPPGKAPDGLPLPPAHLIRVTSGCLRQAVNRPAALFDSYLEAGAQGAAGIRDALERCGLAIDAFDSVLDFGCGCGRVIRNWQTLNASVTGSDYNPILIDWCAQALPFARFARNGLDPPLPFDESSFDFVYAISIFTHLDTDQQLPWLAELARVTAPGGVLLVTVAGPSRAERQLDGADLERFHAGELVVRRADLAGTNACAAFHPHRYVEETFSAGMELLGVFADGAADVRQDQVLLRKPA